MKRLLTILSSFALTGVTLSTVVACEKTKKNEIKDNENKDEIKPSKEDMDKVETTKRIIETSFIPSAILQTALTTLKNEIKVQIESMVDDDNMKVEITNIWKKDSTEEVTQEDFNNKTDKRVVVIIKGKLTLKNASTNFTKNGATIKAIDDQEFINNKANDLTFLSYYRIISVLLKEGDFTVAKAKVEIKKLERYTNIVKNEISLKDDKLDLAKESVLDTILEDNVTVTKNDKMMVTGTIVYKSKEANFKFKVKIIDQSTANQLKLDTVINSLRSRMNNRNIELPSSKLTVANLKDAIKNHQDYKYYVGKDGITLKDDTLFLAKTTATDTVLEDSVNIANDEIITVKGTLKYEDKEKDFTFTVKVKTI